MDYFRLISGLSEHPKWLATTLAGRSVLISLWCYCARAETDGYVPEPAALREGLRGKVADHLEDVGWLRRNGSGWVMHDWLEHQVSASEIATKRDAARRRKRAQRARDAQQERLDV